MDDSCKTKPTRATLTLTKGVAVPADVTKTLDGSQATSLYATWCDATAPYRAKQKAAIKAGNEMGETCASDGPVGSIAIEFFVKDKQVDGVWVDLYECSYMMSRAGTLYWTQDHALFDLWLSLFAKAFGITTDQYGKSMNPIQ